MEKGFENFSYHITKLKKKIIRARMDPGIFRAGNSSVRIFSHRKFLLKKKKQIHVFKLDLFSDKNTDNLHGN